MTIATRIQLPIGVDEVVVSSPLNTAASWSLDAIANITVMTPPPPKPIKQESTTNTRRRTNLWTAEEHERFLHGLELYPQGPWKLVADVVGTRTTRQTMTHAQKYRQKIERHQRMNEAMGRVINSVRSPLLFEGVTATKSKNARAGASPSPSLSPTPPSVSSSPSETIQHSLFDWNHAYDADFHELLASLEPLERV